MSNSSTPTLPVCEKVAEKARDLIVKPVNGLIHDLAERKSLSKQLMFALPIT